MPPKKQAAAAGKSDENPSQLILDYLKVQNRPYSAIDISSNLHNKVTKVKTEKILKELKEKGRVGGSDKDKANVYWALQDPADAATADELAEFDNRIKALRDSLPTLRATVKAKTTSLAQIKSVPSTGELRELISQLEAKKKGLQARLEGLKNGNDGCREDDEDGDGERKAKRRKIVVTTEEKERVDERLRYWKGKEEQRRKIWEGVEDLFLGSMSRHEMFEKIGIDIDDGE